MKFMPTPLQDAYVIELEKRNDSRGFFARTFCLQELADHGIDFTVKQANMSLTLKKGTLRGMHFQHKPHQEGKLVRCTKGALYDVIIDLREDSPTFKQWFGVELTEHNYKMLYVPKGFAHGFVTLEDNTEANYLVSEFYSPEAESGVRYNDPAFNIVWPIEITDVSDKDSVHPDFK